MGTHNAYQVQPAASSAINAITTFKPGVARSKFLTVVLISALLAPATASTTVLRVGDGSFDPNRIGGANLSTYAYDGTSDPRTDDDAFRIDPHSYPFNGTISSNRGAASASATLRLALTTDTDSNSVSKLEFRSSGTYTPFSDTDSGLNSARIFRQFQNPSREAEPAQLTIDVGAWWANRNF